MDEIKFLLSPLCTKSCLKPDKVHKPRGGMRGEVWATGGACVAPHWGWTSGLE